MKHIDETEFWELTNWILRLATVLTVFGTTL